LSIEIELINEQAEYTIGTESLELIRKVLNQAADKQNISSGEVVLSFVDDTTIQHLNKEYRGIDRPTDVLSFAMTEAGEGEMKIAGIDSDTPTMLGDIIISVPRAMAQAEEYGHSTDRELCFLAVHGFLHLIGFDHGSEEEEQEMFSLQETILEELGISR
jgi:probable rRNA maturation factor